MASGGIPIFAYLHALRARRRLAAGLREARRFHRGLHSADWTAPQHLVSEQLVNWSREVLAACRRPHGVAHFDLTVALESAGGTRVLRWKLLEPSDLWREDGPLAHLPGLAEDSRDEVGVRATLFSWGEATYYALTR